MLTPYEILGVPWSADEDTIRAAFRRAAKALHPDVNGADPATENHLKRAIAAYQVLMDPRLRADCDRRLQLRRRRFRRLLVTALASAGAISSLVVGLMMWWTLPKRAL